MALPSTTLETHGFQAVSSLGVESCYIVRGKNPHQVGIMDACDYYNRGAIITRLNVPEEMRRQGVATKLLTMICADADKTQTRLWLEIAPYPGTDYKVLEALYKAFGFKDRGGIWCRLPS